MYKEANKFNKIALPIFTVICLLVFLLSGCGSDIQGTTVVTITDEIIVEVEVPEDTIQDTYFFEEIKTGELSGALGITVDYLGRIDIEEIETFRSTNENASFGTHPRINISNLEQVNSGLLFYASDITYSSGTDLEKDGTTSDLSLGRHYTVYILEFDENDKLNLTIQIHDGSSSSSGGINQIVIERKFKEI